MRVGIAAAAMSIGLLTSACGTSADDDGTSVATPGRSDRSVGEITTIWPTLDNFDPITVAPGDEATVSGNGGYVRTADGGYNESARSFVLLVNDVALSSELSCFANHCQGTFTVPESAPAGPHTMSTEGGSTLLVNVGS